MCMQALNNEKKNKIKIKKPEKSWMNTGIDSIDTIPTLI